VSHPVDVWTVALEPPRAVILSDDEQVRANRFVFERDRTAWAQSRTILRCILASYAGVPPAALVFAYGEHGKPSLPAHPDLQFNLSHAGGFAMVAVTAGCSVGVDLEAVRPSVDIGSLLRRLGETGLPEDRNALYQVWTRREARTKALCAPLMKEPVGDLRLVDLRAPAGFAASLALVGADPGVRYRS